jgi:hypothetical protein
VDHADPITGEVPGVLVDRHGVVADLYWDMPTEVR